MLYEAAIVGIAPCDFWAMTPRELKVVLAGYRRRQEDDMQRRAWEASIMIKCVTGTSIHPMALLGQEPPDQPPEPATKEEFDALMRERVRVAKYGEL